MGLRPPTQVYETKMNIDNKSIYYKGFHERDTELFIDGYTFSINNLIF